MTGPLPDRRSWRWLFVGYALALTLATHWPKLRLGTEDTPAPDKLIHLLAFGALAVLLWRTGWVRSPIRWMLIALAWTVVDEVTQAIPVLRRSISWHDVAAGQLGVVIAVAWRWALTPVGGPAARARSRFEIAAFEHVFDRLRNWLIAGAIGMGAALLLGAITWLAVGKDLTALLLVSFAGGLVGLHLSLEGMRRRLAIEMAEQRRCLDCHASCAGVDFEDTPMAACPACGASQWVGQWQPRLELPRARFIRLATGPVLIAAAIFGSLFLLYMLAVVAHMAWPGVGRLTRAYHGLPDDFRLAIDLTLVALAAALVQRLSRRAIARVIDRQAAVCMYCGHDLRGAAGGRCGECGREFFESPGS